MRQTWHTEVFEAERGRLVGIAAKVLADRYEAEDIVQQAWLRLNGSDTLIDNVPAWLTTVTVRLCLDRLRERTPEPAEQSDAPADGIDLSQDLVHDPAHEVELAATVAVALHVVLDRLTPKERVAFVLHDTFGFEFAAVAVVLDTTPVAARKLASRARAKVSQPARGEHAADGAVVDAFLLAAREGDFEALLHLLAPDVVVSGDKAAIVVGTPERIEGQQKVASFFNGAAASALPVFIDGRPGAAWFLRGSARVAFDFTITGGVVSRIDFRADPDLLERLSRRRVTPGRRSSSVRHTPCGEPDRKE